MVRGGWGEENAAFIRAFYSFWRRRLRRIGSRHSSTTNASRTPVILAEEDARDSQDVCASP